MQVLLVHLRPHELSIVPEDEFSITSNREKVAVSVGLAAVITLRNIQLEIPESWSWWWESSGCGRVRINSDIEDEGRVWSVDSIGIDTLGLLSRCDRRKLVLSRLGRVEPVRQPASIASRLSKVSLDTYGGLCDF
jgi:hypothetical protein